MTQSNLVNLKIKQDYDGNLYVLVPDENEPCVYSVVYLTAIEEPEEGHVIEGNNHYW